MPVYQYKCDSCGSEFSTRLKVSDRNEPVDNECPHCAIQGFVKMVIGTPMVSYSTNPGMTTSDNFNSRLQSISENRGKGCTIQTRREGV